MKTYHAPKLSIVEFALNDVLMASNGDPGFTLVSANSAGAAVWDESWNSRLESGS